MVLRSIVIAYNRLTVPTYGARDNFEEEVTTVNLADNLADLIFMRFLYFYEWLTYTPA
jgi:hypothetical protein